MTSRKAQMQLQGQLKILGDLQVQHDAKLAAIKSKVSNLDDKLSSMMSLMAMYDGSKSPAMKEFEYLNGDSSVCRDHRLKKKPRNRGRFPVVSNRWRYRNLHKNKLRYLKTSGNKTGKINCTPVENHDNMQPKIEMPVFNGKYPFLWIMKLERFYRVGKYRDEEKLDLVSLCIENI
uniref:Uncharacterized protein n=1 Tax=Noccaea caerulescens TaxID=107243 RepID=A0A1J3G3K5_NOCCA